jgi:tetratricopeptide (TPR) repeat protein
MAAVARDEGDYAQAEALCQESLEMAERRGDQFWKGMILAKLGSIAHRQGDGPRALALYQQALGYWHDGFGQIPMLGFLEELAWALVGVGGHDPATRLLAYCAQRREHGGLALARPEQPHHDQAVAAARQALGEEAYAEVWAQGEGLTLEGAIDLALAGDIA